MRFYTVLALVGCALTGWARASILVPAGTTYTGSGVASDYMEVYGILSPDHGRGSLTVSDLYLLSGSQIQLLVDHPAASGKLISRGKLEFYSPCTLTIASVPGDALAAGDGFDLLDWGSLSGPLPSVHLPPLESGLEWNTSRLWVDGTLSVIPEPGGVLLGGIGALALMRWSRRA